MQLQIPYGKARLNAEIADSYCLEVLLPKDAAPAADPASAVKAAVHNPLGDVRRPQKGQRVAIAINDKTRPVPHEYLLPPLLAGIRRAGIPNADVALVIACGTHPLMPPDEYQRILPLEILRDYRVICHDADNDADLTYLGRTSRGTPVHVNREYVAADYRIVVGNIEPHQFQGFSGGVKSAAIGLAGSKTIHHNHAMMGDSHARLGEYERNPARQDVEEIGRMIGIDFALNAILDPAKRIVSALAGDPLAVMTRGISELRAMVEIAVAAPYDLMIVSPGGHPKDINLYQSQKGMAHAAAVAKAGGAMILCAACPEGSGSQSYEAWMMDPQIKGHADVFARFAHEGFRVGPHKAFQISRDASRIHTAIVSELDDELVRTLLLHPMPDLQTAIDGALERLPRRPRIGVMPAANATIPRLEEWTGAAS